MATTFSLPTFRSCHCYVYDTAPPKPNSQYFPSFTQPRMNERNPLCRVIIPPSASTRPPPVPRRPLGCGRSRRRRIPGRPGWGGLLIFGGCVVRYDARGNRHIIHLPTRMHTYIHTRTPLPSPASRKSTTSTRKPASLPPTLSAHRSASNSPAAASRKSPPGLKSR